MIAMSMERYTEYKTHTQLRISGSLTRPMLLHPAQYDDNEHKEEQRDDRTGNQCHQYLDVPLRKLELTDVRMDVAHFNLR
jgi:hypothetical protein